MVERTLLPHRLAASLLITAFALASCGSFPPGGSASVAPPAETAAAAAPTPPATQAPVVPTEPAATAVPADTAAPATAAPTAAPTTQPAPTAQPAAFASEIMFLRQGVLTAYDTQTRAERLVADGVRDFAATPDGSRMALVRENERTTDLWLVQRDGSGLARLTSDGNERIEATPSWAPDGLTLAFAAADSSDQYTRRWPDWASWCAVSQVVALDLPSGAQRPLGAGCDPAFSPDGRRVAFAAPPSEPEPGLESLGATAANSIRLVNRQGQNGWDFATAEGAEAADVETGRLVYAPSWSPSGDRVLYQRFVGMQVETDVNVSELAGSFQGQGQPVLPGAGWLLPGEFAPDGRTLAVTEHNYGDARGFGGYDAWSAAVIRLDGSREVAMPSGSVTMAGTPVGESLARAQHAVWSPDGEALAVQLPPDWRPGLPEDEPLDPGGAERLGEVWRWRPGSAPEERLIVDVDFASPLAWLPPAPSVFAGTNYGLAAPAGWQLAAPSEFEERTAVAPDGVRLASVAPYAPIGAQDLGAQTAAGMFPAFVTSGGRDEDAVPWPDGSVYREFAGTAPDGTPVAGATRIVRLADGATVVALFRSTPERWPLDRPLAQALLARSGPTP